ncbi:MAG: NAD(P)H-dependent oxidoreductase subunit E [Candidatus Hydrothermales bacterium]
MADNKFLINRIHEERGYVGKEKAEVIAKERKEKLANLYEFLSFYSLFHTKPKGKNIIRVCKSLSCHLEGKDKIISKLKELLKIEIGETTPDGEFTLEYTSCLGACALSPVIMINDVLIPKVTCEKIPYLIKEFKEKEPSPLKIPISAPYEKLLLRNVYEIDSLSIKDYLKRDGYKALEMALRKERDAIIEEIKKADLRGRGGAGFKTGLKWELVKEEKEKPKFVICNADEGEPGTFKDRVLIENDPHSVIEGMIIAGYVVDAEKGFVYIRGEYGSGLKILKNAIEEAKENGFLGKNIYGSNFSFDIEIIKGGGGYICGEETALMESIEGKRGEPRKKPPYPSEKGLFGKPTLINNVETFANIPIIISKGADFYKTHGTILLSLSGDLNFKGVCEIPFGTSLEYVIKEIGGGIKDGNLKFLILGGLSGNLLLPSHLNIKMDYESLSKANLSFGSGAIIAISDKRCSVCISENIIEFFMDESCGKCIPCSIGTYEASKIIKNIIKGEKEDINLLFEIAETMELSSFCPLGQTSLRIIKSIAKEFKEEWEFHKHE